MSTIEQTCARLREIKLTTMAQAYELQAEQPKLQQHTFDERFALLVDSEVAGRENRKLSQLVRVAALPDKAAFEEIDNRPTRGLDKALLSTLSSCGWIRRQQNLIVVGATGVGKTWLACAFGHQACRLKIPVAFYRTSDLYTAIGEAVHDGSLPKLKLTLSKPSLLILDDFGIGEMSASAAQVLLDVVDRRMRTGSLLITSQYPTDKWHSFFPDPTVADAVLDRVVHQAHRIQLKGESMRKLQGRKRLEEA
ncbi:IS21-like element helper ATPase IstB [Variovorax sp. GB1P17]|uniref:IS21-like element helper ATPase IstB n=1 Tax=Variovorax sp. GB1P17 TaxID=3443740 RepID=UPI003F44846E